MVSWGLVMQVRSLQRHMTTFRAEEKWWLPFESFSLSNFISLSSLYKFTLTLYNAIVLPHFDYADIVLSSASAASKCKLQSLQTRAPRLITGSGPRTSRNPMYKSLSWLLLQHRQDFHKCVMVYKCCNSLPPSYVEIFFTSYDTKTHI